MQLRPFRFLWKQLCGPQITAIMAALYRWFSDSFNTTLKYLTTLSIDTANDAHLTLLGACQGIRRPIVVLKDSSNFIFTYEPEREKDYGVSIVPDPESSEPIVGGRFTDLQQDLRNTSAVLCPPVFYRAILQAKRDSYGSGSSIVFLDNMLSNCWKAVGNTSTPIYHIEYSSSSDLPQNRTWGDIRVVMGPLTAWGDTDTAVQWQSVLSEVFNALLNPNSYVTFDFSA